MEQMTFEIKGSMHFRSSSKKRRLVLFLGLMRIFRIACEFQQFIFKKSIASIGIGVFLHFQIRASRNSEKQTLVSYNFSDCTVSRIVYSPSSPSGIVKRPLCRKRRRSLQVLLQRRSASGFADARGQEEGQRAGA